MTQDDNPKLPHVTPELIEFLAQMFPDQCPRLGTPMEQVWFRAGEANVVRALRNLLIRLENPDSE